MFGILFTAFWLISLSKRSKAFLYASGSQSSACIGITWRICQNIECQGPPRVSDSVGLIQGPKICVIDKFSGDAESFLNAADLPSMLLYTGHRTRHTPFCRQLCVPPSAEESRASTGKDFMLSEAEVSRGHYPCCLTSGGERYNLVPGTMQWLTLQLLSSGHREALSRSWKEQQRAEGKCGGV